MYEHKRFSSAYHENHGPEKIKSNFAWSLYIQAASKTTAAPQEKRPPTQSALGFKQEHKRKAKP